METLDVMSTVYDWAVCVIMDFLIFVAIDYASKIALRSTRTAPARRRVWLYESLWLVLAGVVVGYLHHAPYLLLLFALPTFAYALLYGRTSLSRASEAIWARWNEFKEHHESLEALRELESWNRSGFANHVSPAQQADFMRASASPTIVINPQNTRPGLNPAGQLRSLRFNEQKAVYEFVGVRDGGGSGGQQQQQQCKTGESTAAAAPAAISLSAQPPPRASGSAAAMPAAARGASDVATAAPRDGQGLLRRRPIREQQLQQQRAEQSATAAAGRAPAAASDSASVRLHRSSAWGWGTRVLSALGIGRAASAAPGGGDGGGSGAGMPPGLRNPGSSLCFVNATLQCLARSPNLADDLAEESKGAVASDAHPSELALLDLCAELMQKTGVHPAENDCPVLDYAQELREAGSLLNADLFSSVHRQQQQQDAAEFLTWLLSELHDVINESNSKGSKKVLQKGYLQQLQQIYGDLTTRQCEQLKAACWQEIAEANGLNIKSYAEAIQRLSDMEWLSYKHKNYSIVDDLFTGQMIETRVCTRCAGLAVSIQPFNLLSVPLPEASAVVAPATTLDACLQAYGTVETLRSAEGARCEACLRRSSGVGGCVTPPRSIVPSAVMSPIPGSQGSDVAAASSLLDGTFLTSTPAAGGAKAAHQAATADGGMQRRCLLRQLPDCLVLQLMRFQYDAALQRSRKIKTAVSVPLHSLDLSHIIYDAVTCRQDLTASQNEGSDGAGCHYSLYGVCLHLGAESTSYGHYVSYARAVDGKWYMFDDENVAHVSDMAAELRSKAVQENCYLLFYRRQVPGWS